MGLISAHATASSPLPGGDGALLVAARRTYLDAATAAAHALGLLPTRLPYGFSDVYLKATRDVGELGSLSLSGYLNSEAFWFGRDVEESSNMMTDLGWGSRLSRSTTASRSAARCCCAGVSATATSTAIST